MQEPLQKCENQGITKVYMPEMQNQYCKKYMPKKKFKSHHTARNFGKAGKSHYKMQKLVPGCTNISPGCRTGAVVAAGWLPSLAEHPLADRASSRSPWCPTSTHWNPHGSVPLGRRHHRRPRRNPRSIEERGENRQGQEGKLTISKIDGELPPSIALPGCSRTSCWAGHRRARPLPHTAHHG